MALSPKERADFDEIVVRLRPGRRRRRHGPAQAAVLRPTGQRDHRNPGVSASAWPWSPRGAGPILIVLVVAVALVLAGRGLVALRAPGRRRRRR